MHSSPLTSDLAIPSQKLASLRTISLYQLLVNSESEKKALLDASVQDGFFYLDLTHPTFSSLLEYVDGTFKLAEGIFDYPNEIKSLFDVDAISDLKTNGYKPLGRNVVAKTGQCDGFESWVLPRNGIMQLSKDPFPHPPAIAKHFNTLTGLVEGLSSAAHLIFSSLSSSLAITDGQHFEDFQRLSKPSPDILRLLKYHAGPATMHTPQTPHTDLGSLTFVFSTTPGLQVLPAKLGQSTKAPSESDWQYVQPLAGHAVVNIGDCLSIMTNGLLKSALHRVGPVAGYAMPERYSLAYLLRPEDSTVLRTLDSPSIPQPLNGASGVTSGDWIRTKFRALRGQLDTTRIDSVLTGGRGIMA